MKGLECIVNGCSYHNSSGNCHTLTFRKWMSDDVALPENTICTFTLMYMAVVSEKWMIVPSSICWCILFSEKKSSPKNSLATHPRFPWNPSWKIHPSQPLAVRDVIVVFVFVVFSPWDPLRDSCRWGSKMGGLGGVVKPMWKMVVSSTGVRRKQRWES